MSHDEAAARLAERVRALIDATVRTQVPTEELEKAADELEPTIARLSASLRDGARPTATGKVPHNAVSGMANPWAPPVTVEVHGDLVVGHVTLGSVHEGPPGRAHGGVLSLILDHLLGYANSVTGRHGMTVDLRLRYRRATPLWQPLRFEARHTGVDGRRIFAEGRVLANDVVTVVAQGVFMSASSRTPA